jgi:hypothetical protein
MACAAVTSVPTVAARLARRMIVLCADAALADSIANAVPPGWEVTRTTGVAELGGFQDVLLHRFALLDLDEREAFDPVGAIEEIRGAMMLNIPIFCFGGDAATRDAARRARADRFFERSEIAERLPQLCERFDW